MSPVLDHFFLSFFSPISLLGVIANIPRIEVLGCTYVYQNLTLKYVLYSCFSQVFGRGES